MRPRQSRQPLHWRSSIQNQIIAKLKLHLLRKSMKPLCFGATYIHVPPSPTIHYVAPTMYQFFLTKLFLLPHYSFLSGKIVIVNWVWVFFRLSVSQLMEEMLAERLWSRKMLRALFVYANDRNCLQWIFPKVAVDFVMNSWCDIPISRYLCAHHLRPTWL